MMLSLLTTTFIIFAAAPSVLTPFNQANNDDNDNDDNNSNCMNDANDNNNNNNSYSINEY